MNKKLLFAAMSLAALTACSTDDFESQNAAEQTVSPIQFEVINNDATTRASMTGNNRNTISWSANDGDLFTLYHGGSINNSVLGGYQNATYKAVAEDGKAAALTTPSMILDGKAIMTWPVDTTFRATGNGLTIVIPTEQTNIENNIPYVSDVIDIKTRVSTAQPGEAGYYAIGADNTAGYNRKYPVFMRPMASQLNLKAEYVGTDKIQELVDDADDPIHEITINSLQLLTDESGQTKFTKEIALKFTEATTTGENPDRSRWDAAVTNNAWSHVTGFDIENISTEGKTATLTTTCPIDDDLKNGCKFLILPQGKISNGVTKAAVVVDTYYGKVLIANPNDYNTSKYTVDEYNAAWYRYVSNSKRVTTPTNEENASATTAETSGDNAGKYKTVAKSLALGMQQTINDFSGHKAGSDVVKGEPTGYALTRYVNVDLAKLDMSELHIKDDQQLRDVVRVWDKLGLGTVTVILDGDKDTKEFKISQKTIKTINKINAAAAEETPSRQFAVKPCRVTDEACNTIVITGGGDVQDMTFISWNNPKKADIAFNEGETWNWKGTVKVRMASNAALVNSFINRGTMNNAETATLKVTAPNGTKQFNVPFVNDGKWNITAGTLSVQFSVTNNGTVNISDGAQYRQDGTAGNTTFTNEATDLPERFGGDDSKIGVVNNSGVFATVSNSDGTKLGKIINYGLIEHETANAKTYITENQTNNASFASPFRITTNTVNKMGRINLKYDNRGEDNVSISATDATGFVSVTVDANSNIANGELKAEENELGTYVNYIIVKGGVQTISSLNAQYKYVEINQPGTEIAWTTGSTSRYEGLIVLSDVNITIGTTVTAAGTYLGTSGTMYVGGIFNKAAVTVDNTTIPATSWNAYYGNTADNVATHYVNTGVN